MGNVKLNEAKNEIKTIKDRSEKVFITCQTEKRDAYSLLEKKRDECSALYAKQLTMGKMNDSDWNTLNSNKKECKPLRERLDKANTALNNAWSSKQNNKRVIELNNLIHKELNPTRKIITEELLSIRKKL